MSKSYINNPDELLKLWNKYSTKALNKNIKIVEKRINKKGTKTTITTYKPNPDIINIAGFIAWLRIELKQTTLNIKYLNQLPPRFDDVIDIIHCTIEDNWIQRGMLEKKGARFVIFMLSTKYGYSEKNDIATNKKSSVASLPDEKIDELLTAYQKMD